VQSPIFQQWATDSCTASTSLFQPTVQQTLQLLKWWQLQDLPLTWELVTLCITHFYFNTIVFSVGSTFPTCQPVQHIFNYQHPVGLECLVVFNRQCFPLLQFTNHDEKSFTHINFTKWH
jgi:hypothetical protein